MDDKKKEFKKAVMYKIIGFWSFFIAIIPMVILEGVISYVVAILIMGLSFYIERKFRCPYCRFIFDPRMKTSELIYCPKCSGKLQ